MERSFYNNLGKYTFIDFLAVGMLPADQKVTIWQKGMTNSSGFEIFGFGIGYEKDRWIRALLPDGTERFLVDQQLLDKWVQQLDALQLDPLKTTNVNNQRCMTTWILQKPA